MVDACRVAGLALVAGKLQFAFSPDWYSPKLHVLIPYSVGGVGLQHSKAVRSTRSLNTH